MPVVTREVNFHTKGNTEVHDITHKVVEQLETCKIKNGVITLFVPGSTASITTIPRTIGTCRASVRSRSPMMIHRFSDRTTPLVPQQRARITCSDLKWLTT